MPPPVAAKQSTLKRIRELLPVRRGGCRAHPRRSHAAVLRTGAILFEPPLPPEHCTALASIVMGRVEKASLLYDRRWWPRSPGGYLRLHGEDAREISEWLDLTDAVGAPVITGIFADSFAERLWSGRDDDEVAASVVAHVAQAVGQTEGAEVPRPSSADGRADRAPRCVLQPG